MVDPGGVEQQKLETFFIAQDLHETQIIEATCDRQTFLMPRGLYFFTTVVKVATF